MLRSLPEDAYSLKNNMILECFYSQFSFHWKQLEIRKLILRQISNHNLLVVVFIFSIIFFYSYSFFFAAIFHKKFGQEL